MAERLLIYTQRSLNDLEEIRDYVETRSSPRMAKHVIEEILAAIERVVELPGVGHKRRDLSPQYYVTTVFRYLIIYRYDALSLHVVRVVHGHRDLSRISLR